MFPQPQAVGRPGPETTKEADWEGGRDRRAVWCPCVLGLHTQDKRHSRESQRWGLWDGVSLRQDVGQVWGHSGVRFQRSRDPEGYIGKSKVSEQLRPACGGPEPAPHQSKVLPEAAQSHEGASWVESPRGKTRLPTLARPNSPWVWRTEGPRRVSSGARS